MTIMEASEPLIWFRLIMSLSVLKFSLRSSKYDCLLWLMAPIYHHLMSDITFKAIHMIQFSLNAQGRPLNPVADDKLSVCLCHNTSFCHMKSRTEIHPMIASDWFELNRFKKWALFQHPTLDNSVQNDRWKCFTLYSNCLF